MSFNFKFLLSLVFFVFGSRVMAADMGLGQGRLFLGSTKTSPSELNTELTAQGLKNVDLNNQFGIEITFPTFQYLRLGLRYTHHLISQDETVSDPTTDYKAGLTQDALMGIARVPLLKTDYLHFDVFAGAGVNNSTYTEKTASQDGKLEKSASPVLAAGASLALGFKQYFVFFEGGYESNKLDDMKRSGNLNSNVNSIDLSGSYFLVGLMFDGIPIFSK
jgi:hypothetical protein